MALILLFLYVKALEALDIAFAMPVQIITVMCFVVDLLLVVGIAYELIV